METIIILDDELLNLPILGQEIVTGIGGTCGLNDKKSGGVRTLRAITSKSLTKTNLKNFVKNHNYIKSVPSPPQPNQEREWILARKQEFEDATTLAQMKVVLAKLFKKIYERWWD